MEKSTCDLSDAYGEQARVVPPIFRSFGGRRRFQGAVVTIKCYEDNSRVKELVGTLGEGRVLVVDGGGSQRYALMGDMLAQQALGHGWVGVIIFGCVRDTAVLETLNLGIQALGATPRRSLKNGEGQVNVPVEIAGTRCNPGDMLFADEDGILLIDPAVLAAKKD
jgi:regulator of ribonuclease activity A